MERLIRFGEKLIERFKYMHSTEIDYYRHHHLPVLKIDDEDISRARLNIKTAELKDLSDVKEILNDFREGNVIIIVKIKELREKSMKDLKKAIDRFKTHCATTGADLAGIDEDWIILSPSNARIVRS